MKNNMKRSTVAGLGVAVLLLAAWVFQVFSAEDDLAKVAPSLAALEAPAKPSPTLVIPAQQQSAPLLVEHPAVEVAKAESDESRPLSVQVLHAHESPAVGGRVALYLPDRSLAGEGVLDRDGRWSHPGVDGPVAVFVLGLSTERARFELTLGRGEHTLTLPAGAVLTGQLLVNGLPPGQPFPLALDAVPGDWAALQDHEERPAAPRLAGEVLSKTPGGFYTDANGHFQLSGLAAGSEVQLQWPRFYEPDDSYPLTLPWTVPASGVVLALRRPFMIRGRVLTGEGLPAAEAEITVKLIFSRQVFSSSRVSISLHDAAVANDGRFAIAIGSPFMRGRSAEADAAPIEMNLDLVARSPDGSWVSASLVDEVVTRDHLLGDLVLRPAQRVTLLVVDPQGQPVAGAKVRPESDRGTPAVLETDEAGQVLIDLAVATLELATVVADGFATELVALPTRPPEQPLQVTLTPACAVRLRLRGPWDDEEDPSNEWRFLLSVVADGSAYHDSILSPTWQRQGPDVLRGIPDGFAGLSEVTNLDDGAVEWGWHMGVSELLFEGLRADHPMRFSVRVTGTPDSFGPPPEGMVWESEEIWLGAEERRELVADLRHLQPGKAQGSSPSSPK